MTKYLFVLTVFVIGGVFLVFRDDVSMYDAKHYEIAQNKEVIFLRAAIPSDLETLECLRAELLAQEAVVAELVVPVMSRAETDALLLHNIGYVLARESDEDSETLLTRAGIKVFRSREEVAIPGLESPVFIEREFECVGEAT